MLKYTGDPRLHKKQSESEVYYLRNERGTIAAITNYGARWAGLWLPVDDKFIDVVAGFSNAEDYKSPDDAYYGAIVGRYANRIAGGRFKLNGRDYQLAINNPPNHLHGGPGGLHQVTWDIIMVSETSVTLRYISPNGEEGYPGELEVTVTYTLNEKNQVEIEITARCNEDTIVNITNHAYFNLNGEGSGSIEDHLLSINASSYTPVNEYLIPTGEIAAVEGTPFDFRKERTISTEQYQGFKQLKYGKGYDHNFVCDGSGFRKIATVKGERVAMEVFTDQPGVQFYAGNFMAGKNTFRSGAKDDFRTAFCLEAQHFPDSPNQPGFPTVILKKGEKYFSKTCYGFTVV